MTGVNLWGPIPASVLFTIPGFMLYPFHLEVSPLFIRPDNGKCHPRGLLFGPLCRI
jgi:hypothetical protein